MSGVQLLNSEYVSKVNPQQVQKWIEDGKVIKQGNKYYVAGNNIGFFPESCFVKEGDSAKLYQINTKGTIVERTTPEPKGEVVGTPKKSYSVNVSGIIERMGLTDEALKNEFKAFLSSQKGLTVDKEGNISFSDQSALNTALAGFAQQHKENFVDPNAPKFVEFTQESDQEAIDALAQGDDPAIESKPTTTDTRRYAVKNETALTTTLSTPVGKPSYEAVTPRSASIEASVTTTTTTKEGMVEVPDNLRENKKGRKMLEADAREAYADLVAHADPELRNAIDLYIAERRYSGKINKKMNELSEYTTTMGGRKEKEVKRDGADIVQLYINEYVNEEDKKRLNGLATQLKNPTKLQNKLAILQALKDNNIAGMQFSEEQLIAIQNDKTLNEDQKQQQINQYINETFDKLSDNIKYKGALLGVAKACGYEPNDLLRLMATYEVMNDENRSSEQIIKDDKYFIEQQAKDYVKNQQATQDLSNTTVHFSKQGRTNAPDDGKIHTDIGNKGRALVKACPEMLGNEVTDAKTISQLSSLNDKQLEEQGYVKATINGQEKYFQFSQDKWQTFMGICCDPSRATDEEMTVLFGNDKERKEAFLKDLNLTLQEGRSVLEMNLPSPYGETGTIQFANIVANNNGKIDNRELNALRDMAESAGYSVDSNTTFGKRLLHVLKNAGVGAGLGILTGGLGSLLSGAVNIAGTTASQMVGFSGRTADRFIDYSGRTADRVINDSTTFKYNNNGETYSQTVTKHITVEGQDYSGQVRAEGQNYSGQVEAKGQDYSGSGDNHWKTAGNAGILGAIAGVTRGLATMNGVHERGRNTDDIFDLTRFVEHEEVENESLSIQIPQFTKVETRKGQMEVGTEPIIHQYTTIIAGVKQELMACYPNATTDDYAQILNAVAQANGIEGGNATGKLWAGRYTDTNGKKHNGIYVPPTITLSSGKVVKYEEKHTTAKRTSSGGSGNNYDVTSNNTKRTLKAQGTIR